jgi:hypothetical protein
MTALASQLRRIPSSTFHPSSGYAQFGDLPSKGWLSQTTSQLGGSRSGVVPVTAGWTVLPPGSGHEFTEVDRYYQES